MHLYGQCCDMDAILKVARKYKLKIVEDTAQAFGAEFKGKKAGSMGDCGAISFVPGKNLGAFGDAGMVITNNRSVAEKLRILRNQGNIDRYHHLMVGYNHRMDTIQAAVLLVKLKYLDLWNKKRQDNAGYFNEYFWVTPHEILWPWGFYRKPTFPLNSEESLAQWPFPPLLKRQTP